MVYLHCRKCTLLTPVQLVHRDLQLLLCKPASSQSGSKQFCCMGYWDIPCKVPDFALPSLNFMKFLSVYFSILSRFPWMTAMPINGSTSPSNLWTVNFFFSLLYNLPMDWHSEDHPVVPQILLLPFLKMDVMFLSFSVIKTSPDTTTFQRWERSQYNVGKLPKHSWMHPIQFHVLVNIHFT